MHAAVQSCISSKIQGGGLMTMYCMQQALCTYMQLLIFTPALASTPANMLLLADRQQ
jgi:hypothetical protein